MHNTHNQLSSIRLGKTQKGAVLFISLIMLLVMTLIGVTGMRTTVLEEKMTSNLRDRGLAFQAAEAAILDAEELLDTLVSTGSFDGSLGRLGPSDDDPDFFDTGTWAADSSIGYSGSLADVATQPRYILKYVGTVKTNTGDLSVGSYGSRDTSVVTIFRITARGTGGSDSAQVILESHYGRVL